MCLRAITNVCPMTSVRGIYLKVSLDRKYNSAGHHIGANCTGITLEYSRLIYWASTGHDSEREKVDWLAYFTRTYQPCGVLKPLAMRLSSTHWYKPSSQVEIAMMKEAVFNITAQFSATVMKMVMSISAKGSATIKVIVLDFSRKH